MSNPMNVDGNETGVIRIFTLNLHEGEADAYIAKPDAQAGNGQGHPLPGALGVDVLDFDFVEVFPVSQIAELSLARYLADGYAVTDPALASDAGKLNALTGYVAIVMSSAFDGKELTLDPKPPLHHFATYREAPVVPPMDPLGSDAAQRSPSRDAVPVSTSRRKRGPSSVGLLLGFLAALIAAVVLLMARNGAL